MALPMFSDNKKAVLVKNLVDQEHNVLILGQAGTAKTSLLREICLEQINVGKKVIATGSTGIASCTLATGGVPVATLHHSVGLLDGRFSAHQVIQRFEENRLIWSKAIDEISMVSGHTMSKVHRILAQLRGSDRPFGGVQVLGAGDFFQLSPVPNARYGDQGDYAFQAPVFERTFPHKVELVQNYRQGEDIDLIRAIKETARGDVSRETSELLNQRQNIFSFERKPQLALFATNAEVDFYNARCLAQLQSEPVVFDFNKDTYVGNATLLN